MSIYSITKHIEKRSEDFLYDLRKTTFDHFSGLSQEYTIEDVYVKYSDLFSEEHVFSILQIYRNNNGKKERHLLKFLIEGYIGQLVKSIDAEITKEEATGIIINGKDKIPYRTLLHKLYNTPDRQKRHKLDKLRRIFIDRFNEKRIIRINYLNDKSKFFGFNNYAELNQEFKQADFNQIHHDCVTFLELTAKRYHSELNHYFNEYEIPSNSKERSDILYIARAKNYDPFFPSEKQLPTVNNTLKHMGINLNKQSNISLDTEVRPQKASRPFCLAIKTPQDIRLVINGVGGQEDYMNLFHEMGHAQHFAHINKKLSFTFKNLGDYSITEGHAFLFQSLISNFHWLKCFLCDDHDIINNYIRLASFLKLYLIRRYSTKFIYEYKLYAAGISEKTKSEYTNIFTYHLGVNYYPEDYLTDIDIGFYSLNYIRAWILESLLNKHLNSYYGATWFLSKRAGNFLKSLWKSGNQHCFDELCYKLNSQSNNLSILAN